MLIALLRHGPAEDAGPRTSWEDAPRELTDDGRARMVAAATGIARLGLDIDRILTSPLIRCVQTAEIVGTAVGITPRVDEWLRPGLTADRLINVLFNHPDASTMLVCGHQPDLSYVTSELVGGGDVEFKKGALAVIDLTELRSNGGFLRALYPPASLRTIGGA